MKTIKLLSILFIGLTVFTACSDDDNPIVINEEEVITTVEVTLTNDADTTDQVILTSTDLDGDGPNDPVVTIQGTLTAGVMYNGMVKFLNETEDPAEDITEEVAAEADEHQVFYQVGNLGTVTYSDEDANGNPIGLAFVYNAAATTGTGTITVILRHEPVKDAAGVSNGDITNAGGSTDASVSFDVTLTE